MRQERVNCSLTIDEIEPNVLIIKPFHLQDFQYDSIYEFKLPKIYAQDGSILEAQKIKYITQPSLMYASIEDIKAKLGDIDISDEIILYHIREASRLAEVIVKKAYSKQNIEFSKEDLMQLRGSIEEMRNEATRENALEIARSLLRIDKLTCEEIAQATKLTVDEVKELEEKRSS